jgi:L-asparaginase
VEGRIHTSSESDVFDDVLLRGNRTVKVHADSYRGFASPNYPPLATAGVTIDIDTTLVRPPGTGPIRRRGGISDAVTALRLHPGLNAGSVRAVLDRPDLRGVVLEAYGAGNGPADAWFLDPVRSAVDRGVTVVVTTQCRAGSVIGAAASTPPARHCSPSVQSPAVT